MSRDILLCLLVFLIPLDSYAQMMADSTKKVNVAAIPIINYDPAFGVNVGFLGQLFYKVNSQDTVSPTSSTSAIGLYTSNKTWFGAIFQRFYLKEDTWRISGGAGQGNINFQYWQELPETGGTFIGFNTRAAFAAVRVERRVLKKLYAGVSGALVRAETTYDIPDYFPDSLRFDERNMNNIGYQLHYDVRDHQMNPYSGFNVEYKNNFFREWMGNPDNFNKYQLTYNHYYRIKNIRNIIATRIKASIATGEVPFQAQNVVGQDDIRGYTSGKYRNDQIYTMQAEYRWRFYKKFGIVGFFGLASAVSSFGQIFSSEILPGAGAGLRYMMIEKERINIGVDAAVGKADWGLYFRIGEAFGR